MAEVIDAFIVDVLIKIRLQGLLSNVREIRPKIFESLADNVCTGIFIKDKLSRVGTESAIVLLEDNISMN